MATRSIEEPPLVVIVGPTASGKTGLAIKLAKKFDGEIICADSRTVYKAMNIGTAKPTIEEQAGVPHWALDLVEPNETFSAAEFKQYALQKIEEIRARGHVPFLVGGTGLYTDAVIFDYQFTVAKDTILRQELDKLSIEELHKYCAENNIELPENRLNKRYIIRSIEQNGINTKRQEQLIQNCIVVGIATDKIILRQRIEQRVEQMFNDGVVGEASLLGEKYGWEGEAMTGNIYPLVHEYIKGNLAFEEMKEKSIVLDWHLAKRQLTWLKRNPHIQWFGLNEAETYLSRILANRHKS
jgi:tRNA dimethylallyltransferase